MCIESTWPAIKTSVDSDYFPDCPDLSLRGRRKYKGTLVSFSFTSTYRKEENPAIREGSYGSNTARRTEFRRVPSKPERVVFERVGL